MRGYEFGGPKPLFCVPLVAAEPEDLIAQATIAHALSVEVVEWRADSFAELTADGAANLMKRLRSVLTEELLIFTLRIQSEGGKNQMTQQQRLACMESAIATGEVDLIDIELCNGKEFIDAVHAMAKGRTRVILSYHDFRATPDGQFLHEKLADMVLHHADVAKIACMPQDPSDVLRLLEATLRARKAFPSTPLCTMSMGGIGCLSRVAGFLYGSDMAFAVARESSAPGQIPVADARAVADVLLGYA
jgi:3-dehydroquinate dehydratase-1